MTLESIIERTHTPYRLIVVDNGSEKKMQDMLKEYHKRGLIHTLVLADKNWGLEHAKNTGLRFVRSKPYFVNTDNDLLIEGPQGGSDWLSKLVNIMDNHPEYGAVACRPQVQLGLMDIYHDEVKEDEVIKHTTEDDQIGFYYGGEGPCGGSFRIMRTEPTKKIGWRDDDPSKSRSEEWRICQGLNKEGYKVGFAKHIRCYHLFGEGNWGYKDGVPHYHESRDFGEPQDVPFDPWTCIPETEQYVTNSNHTNKSE